MNEKCKGKINNVAKIEEVFYSWIKKKKHEKWGKRTKINKKYKDREVKGKAEWRNSKCKERKH